MCCIVWIKQTISESGGGHQPDRGTNALERPCRDLPGATIADAQKPHEFPGIGKQFVMTRLDRGEQGHDGITRVLFEGPIL